MIIGFDAKRLFNNFTGLGNYSRTLVKNLQKYFPEHEYHLFTPGYISNAETAYFLDNSKFILHSYDKPFKSIWRSFGIIEELKRNGIEVYHGLSNELPLNMAFSGIKSVVTIHDLIFKIAPQDYPLLDRMIYNVKFKRACKKADKILAISNSTLNDIIKFYNINKQKCEVLHQACNDIFSEIPKKSEIERTIAKYNLPSKYILSVGSIIRRKNLLTSLKAFNNLSIGDSNLVVVGEGKTYKSDVINFVEKNKLSDRVYFLGNVPNHELRTIYHLAQLTLYLSHYEGFGIPVLESLLSGTRVLTGNSSSLSEFSHPECFQVNTSDLNEISTFVESLLSKDGFEQSHQFVDVYSGNSLSRKLIEIYSNLLSKSH